MASLSTVYYSSLKRCSKTSIGLNFLALGKTFSKTVSEAYKAESFPLFL